jgi:hypothetical protein
MRAIMRKVIRMRCWRVMVYSLRMPESDFSTAQGRKGLRVFRK